MQNIPDTDYIAEALWMDSFDIDAIPPKIRAAITSEKHSAAAFGQRARDYVQWLHDHPLSNTPSYKKRYRALKQAIDTLTPQQMYLLSTNTLGQNAAQGYKPIPARPNIQLPRDHAVQLQSQVGWHFFVGSGWDEAGQEYGIELMFFGIAGLPPEFARAAGLSDRENQIMEMQLAISKAGERHHQARPVIVAGTSGLFDCSAPGEPFYVALGKNRVASIGKSKEFFPLQITTQGKDYGGTEPFELGVDLKLTSDRPVLYQGENGAMPSLAGFGSLYYSIPNLTLLAGSTLNYGGKTIRLKKARMWYDHQWGFLNGAPNSPVLRASMNISGKPPVSGWDWYMQQFDDNRQITVFKTHSTQFKQFYFQTGAKPGSMKVPVAGKYMDERGELHDTWGDLTIDDWVKAETSPDESLYPITHVWHPNHWVFSFDETVPAEIRTFSMEQIVPVAQTNYFANAAQYNEGAVYIKNKSGKLIGRGFAEAVSYADTSNNAYRLLGFDTNRQLVELLQHRTASLPQRVVNLLYLITHGKQLKSIISKSAGMKFLGPRPTAKDAVTRHSR